MFSDVDEEACGAARGLLRVPKSPRGVVLVRPVHHRGVVEEHGFPPSPRRFHAFSKDQSPLAKIRFFHPPKKKRTMKRSLLQAARRSQKETQTRGGQSSGKSGPREQKEGEPLTNQHNHALRPHREYPLYRRPSPPAPRPRPRLRPLNLPSSPSASALALLFFFSARTAPVEGRSRDTLGMCGFEPT